MLRRFFKWGSVSLVGHLALFEICCGAPLYAWSLATMYSEGTLSIVWALWMAVVILTLVAIGAGLFWFTLSKGLINRRR